MWIFLHLHILRFLTDLMLWIKERSVSREMGGASSLVGNIRDKLLKNWFILGIITVILLARANPGFGAKGGNSCEL